MLIPIGHEDMRGRRWPYVTAAIIVANVIVFLYSQGPIHRGIDEYNKKLYAAVVYYAQHNHLNPSPPLDSFLKQLGPKDRELLERIALMSRTTRDMDTAATEDPAIEQAELDRLCAEALEARQRSFLFTYAYVPGLNNGKGIISSQFLHGGWLHLIFNMLFLWLCGCNIEDRWGRLVFPLFYLSAGVVAALAHRASAPHSLIPTVGASGAIAGCMGAFLICFARTRIRFMWFLFLRPRFFSAPAYLMLPWWLLGQVFYGLMVSGLGIQGGVAFWAHVGGFVYGAVFAVAFRYAGFEAKVDRAIEGQISLEQAPEVLQAQELTEQGKHAEAFQLLEQFAAQHATNVDAQLELLRTAKAARDRERESRAYNRLIGLYFMQNAPDTALDLYRECVQEGLDMEVPPALRLKVARQMERLNDLNAAVEEYRNVYGTGQPDVTSFHALLAHAQIALKQGKKAEALQLFTVAQNSPVPHLDSEPTITHGLRCAQALPDSAQAASAD